MMVVLPHVFVAEDVHGAFDISALDDSIFARVVKADL
jgi:hypothetical protein